MEKQPMLAVWNDLQARVETLTVLQAESQRQIDGFKTQTIRRRAGRAPIADLAMAGLLALAVGNFAAAHLEEFAATPVTALPAALLLIFAGLMLHFSVRQLVLSSDLDYAHPVVETQVRLAELRKLRIRATQCACVFGMQWILFPMILGQAFIGVRFILSLNAAWVVSNVVFGLAMILVIDWGLKNSRYAGSLQDAIVGRDLLEAERFLQEIRAFRTEAAS